MLSNKTKWRRVLAICLLTTSKSIASLSEGTIGACRIGDGTCPGTAHVPDSKIDDLPLFTIEDHRRFDRDGFLVVRGLLDKEIVDLAEAGDALVEAADKSPSYFSSVEMGVVFRAGNGLETNVTNAFRQVAFDSILPRAVAELLHLDKSSSVRVLRDVFMSKPVDRDQTCDWHVDDVGFWPESFVSEQDGINVWIALHDMPESCQGSMALSPGSHKAEWRFEAYEGIGQNRTYHGGFTKEEMKEHVSSGKKLLNTCDMRNQSPEIRQLIEESKYVPDIRKGDVIFATRALFHRTLAVTEAGKQFYEQLGVDYLNRYSIRYVPGSARLPVGWTFEWSIAANRYIAGQTLDVAMNESENLPWYPKVWPEKEDSLEEKLDYIADSPLDEAKSLTKAEIFELISLFSLNP